MLKLALTYKSLEGVDTIKDRKLDFTLGPNYTYIV